MQYTILSGSSRTESLTERAATAAGAWLQQLPGVSSQIIRLNQYPVPFVDQVWNSPTDMPESMHALWEQMENTDAFILVTPEYNGSYSALLKNYMDHFPKRIYQRKPMGIVTASPGALGGIRAAQQMQQMICAFFAIPSPHMLTIPFLEKKIAADGSLIDATFEKNINHFMQELHWLSSRLKTTG
jgi:NAD(P)H-dependent FMN reductase